MSGFCWGSCASAPPTWTCWPSSSPRPWTARCCSTCPPPPWPGRRRRSPSAWAGAGRTWSSASAGRDGLALRPGSSVHAHRWVFSAPVARAGPEVDVLALGPEQDQHLGGLRPGAAEPVRGAGVELGGFARLHDEVMLAKPQPQPAGEHVHPLVALVALLIALGLARRDVHLVGADPAGLAGQWDE